MDSRCDEIYIAELHLLAQSGDKLATLEVVHYGVRGQVAHCDPLMEHAPILHIDTQPQLEPVVFRNEVPQARTEGLAQVLDELGEADHMIVGCVALDEVCMAERRLSDSRRRLLDNCRLPFVLSSPLPPVTEGCRRGTANRRRS